MGGVYRYRYRYRYRRVWKFSGSPSLKLQASRLTSSLVRRQHGLRRMTNQEVS